MEPKEQTLPAWAWPAVVVVVGALYVGFAFWLVSQDVRNQIAWGTFWEAMGAIGTVVAAIATVFVIIQNGRLARQAQATAEQAQRNAEGIAFRTVQNEVQAQRREKTKIVATALAAELNEWRKVFSESKLVAILPKENAPSVGIGELRYHPFLTFRFTVYDSAAGDIGALDDKTAETVITAYAKINCVLSIVRYWVSPDRVPQISLAGSGSTFQSIREVDASVEQAIAALRKAAGLDVPNLEHLMN